MITASEYDGWSVVGHINIPEDIDLDSLREEFIKWAGYDTKTGYSSSKDELNRRIRDELNRQLQTYDDAGQFFEWMVKVKGFERVRIREYHFAHCIY
jgi:hypothetical protein